MKSSNSPPFVQMNAEITEKLKVSALFTLIQGKCTVHAGNVVATDRFTKILV